MDGSGPGEGRVKQTRNKSQARRRSTKAQKASPEYQEAAMGWPTRGWRREEAEHPTKPLWRRVYEVDGLLMRFEVLLRVGWFSCLFVWVAPHLVVFSICICFIQLFLCVFIKSTISLCDLSLILFSSDWFRYILLCTFIYSFVGYWFIYLLYLYISAPELFRYFYTYSFFCQFFLCKSILLVLSSCTTKSSSSFV